MGCSCLKWSVSACTGFAAPFCGHAGLPQGSSVEGFLKESEIGVDRLTYYQDFAGRVERLKKSSVSARRLRRNIELPLGAAIRALPLIFKIGSEMLDFVVDRSTYKQGLYMPGSRIPIAIREALGRAARLRCASGLEFCC